MATDRDGIPNSGSAEIASGDSATTVTTVLQTRDDSLFEPEKLVITYPTAGVATQVQFFDAPDGTADGDLPSASLTLDVETTNTPVAVDLDGPALRDIENDVLVEPDGNQDSAVQVYVGGKEIQTNR